MSATERTRCLAVRSVAFDVVVWHDAGRNANVEWGFGMNLEAGLRRGLVIRLMPLTNGARGGIEFAIKLLII